MEYNEQHSYFADAPQGLANSCDTLLLLDDGTKLPAHAAILARSSGVFSSMLDEGPLAAALRKNMVVVPISECTEDVVKRLLSIIYTSDYQKDTTESSALSLASLGHKLDMKDVIKMCDEHLSDLAGFTADVDSVPLQGRSPESILQVMKIADRVNMPKTLACCERHMAIGAKRMKNEAFWEKIPACSSRRSARGLDAVHANFKARAVSKLCPVLDNLYLNGTYTGSYVLENENDVRVSKDDLLEVFLDMKLKETVPPCKAFLEMAEPDSSKTDPSEADSELNMSDSSEA